MFVADYVAPAHKARSCRFGFDHYVRLGTSAAPGERPCFRWQQILSGLTLLWLTPSAGYAQSPRERIGEEPVSPEGSRVFGVASHEDEGCGVLVA